MAYAPHTRILTARPPQILGIAGIAALVLTGCEGTPADNQADPPDGPDETGFDTGAEDTDPEGAEQQGDTPGEIAGEDEDDEGDDPDGESPDEDSQDIPLLSELEEEIWEASLDQDSVTMTAEVPAELLGIAEDQPGDEGGEEGAEAENGHTVDLITAGDLEGDAFSYQVGDIADYLAFGEEVYQSVDSFVAEYEMDRPEGSDTPEPEELRSQLEAEGSWIDMSGILADQVQTPAQSIEEFRDGFLAGTGGDLSELEIEGELDTQEGENVWVYREGDGEEHFEMVVLADEAEPVIISLVAEIEGQQTSMSFTEWNETDAPEEPEEEEIIPEEEIEQVIDSLTQG